VAVPPQTLLDAFALVDQVVAVIDEEPHVLLGARQTCLGQTRFAQCGPGHGCRVDGVGFAVGACRMPRPRHHLGRNADDPLTTREKVALKPSRDVPAVLDGEVVFVG
jgi:hypothetical protein